MRRTLLILLLTLSFIPLGIGDQFSWWGIAPIVTAEADPATCTAKAVGTSSTAVLATGDLPYPGRSCIMITNSGPNVAFCAFGTGNQATTANGQLVLIGETIPMCSQINSLSKQSLPPQNDLACIAFNGGGNTTANIVACDW